MSNISRKSFLQKTSATALTIAPSSILGKSHKNMAEKRFRNTMITTFLLVAPCLYAANNKKPNVLLIYTDDHRYSGVHALGGEDVQTPNLDKLANSGVVFENTHLMGAFTGATSVPSRAMLITGRNLFQIDGVGHFVPPTHTTIGEAFQQAGYHAHHVGKWHQDHATLSRSYNSGGKVSGTVAYLTDQFRMPFCEWNDKGKLSKKDFYLLEYDEKGNVVKRPLSEKDKRGPIGTEKTGPHVSEVLADDAIHFIKDYDDKKPFFMYLAIPCPHDPRQSPEAFRKQYPPEKVKLPPSFMTQHPFDNGHIVLRDEELAPWPRTIDIAKQHLGDYYAIITHMDAQIGRVIEELKRSGQYENTIIIMAGDSGLAVGNHGLIGKQNVYSEDGTHIPFILSGGAIDNALRGKREDALCYVHDIMPTICDAAGIDIPKSASGKSLMPVLKGEKESINDCTYHAYLQFQRAYRKGDYKLIEYVRAKGFDKQRGEYTAGSRVTQLFNLKKDRWECFDLSAFPEHAERIQTMRKEMKKKAMQLGDYADGKRTSYDFWQYYD